MDQAAGSAKEWAIGPSGDGYAWVARASTITMTGIALYRERGDSRGGEDLDEERDACAVLRSLGEARIMAALLEGASVPGRVPGDPYELTGRHDGRTSWRLPRRDGYVSLHLGSDEDPRDVVVTRFSRALAGTIEVVAIVSHGAGAAMPSSARPMPAALGLLDLLVASDRFDMPLGEDEWRLWSEGLPIPVVERPATPRPDNEAITREAMRLREEGFVSTALAQVTDDVLASMGGAVSKETRDAAAGDVAVQYALVCAYHGKAVADEIVEKGPAPSP